MALMSHVVVGLGSMTMMTTLLDLFWQYLLPLLGSDYNVEVRPTCPALLRPAALLSRHPRHAPHRNASTLLPGPHCTHCGIQVYTQIDAYDQRHMQARRKSASAASAASAAANEQPSAAAAAAAGPVAIGGALLGAQQQETKETKEETKKVQ